jgi:hypothetical protein
MVDHGHSDHESSRRRWPADVIAMTDHGVRDDDPSHVPWSTRA